MHTPTQSPKRYSPHPFVTLGAVVLIFALTVISLKTNLLPRPATITIAIALMFVCRWLSRRSANAMRLRQEEEMERLKRTPVLGLDD